MSQTIQTPTVDKLPLSKQLTLATGPQDCTCPTCGHQMAATVAARVKKNSNRQSYKESYKEFKGTCRNCRTIYYGILKLKMRGF